MDLTLQMDIKTAASGTNRYLTSAKAYPTKLNPGQNAKSRNKITLHPVPLRSLDGCVPAPWRTGKIGHPTDPDVDTQAAGLRPDSGDNGRMNNIQAWGETLRLLVELSATAAFALSGLMEAARKKLDVVGICVVAFLSAFGGGTLRDLLLDQRPFFWVQQVGVLWGLLALCVVHAVSAAPAF